MAELAKNSVSQPAVDNSSPAQSSEAQAAQPVQQPAPVPQTPQTPSAANLPK